MINKTNKKVGEEKYDYYGHPTAIVGGKKVLRDLKKVGIMGLVVFAMAAVWAVMPACPARANGAEN